MARYSEHWIERFCRFIQIREAMRWPLAFLLGGLAFYVATHLVFGWR